MTVKIEVRGDYADEMIVALGGYARDSVERRDAALRDAYEQRDKAQDAYGELADRYDAQAKVRDDTATQLAAAMAESEKYYELNKTLSSDLEVCNEHIEHLKNEVANFTNTSNVLGHNAAEVQIMRNDSYTKGINVGYERGRSEQMAENAAELLNRKPPLQAMLGYMLISLTVRSNAPIKFRPYRIETYKSFCAKYSTDAVGNDAYTGGTVGITGLSDLSGKVLFFAESDVTSWSLEVAEKPVKD